MVLTPASFIQVRAIPARASVQMIARQLIDLEAVLPGVDLSNLTARYPAILLEHSAEGVAAKLASLRWGNLTVTYRLRIIMLCGQMQSRHSAQPKLK